MKISLQIHGTQGCYITIAQGWALFREGPIICHLLNSPKLATLYISLLVRTSCTRDCLKSKEKLQLRIKSSILGTLSLKSINHWCKDQVNHYSKKTQKAHRYRHLSHPCRMEVELRQYLINQLIIYYQRKQTIQMLKRHQ